MATFDGVNLLITLDAGVSEIDIVDDVYEPWKDWMLASSNNRRYPAAFRSDGGNPLSSIINQGSYIFLNNSAGWRIKPPEEDITIYLTGNLAVEDTLLGAFVPTAGAFTAAILGLQPVTQGVTPVMASQLRHSAFNGGVWVDIANGNNIITIGDEAGTEKYPVDNFTDALSVADEEGFGTLYIIGDALIDNGLDYRNVVFIGQGRNLSTFILDAAAQLLNTTFLEASITGVLDGDSHIDGCIIDDLSFVSGVIERCILNPQTITLGGTEIAHFINCNSGIPGIDTPTVDCGGAGRAAAFRNFNGGFCLTNKTGPESISIDLNSGQVRLTTTVTNGLIVARGVGKLVDDATGQRIQTGTWNGVNILNELIDSADLALIRYQAQTVYIDTEQVAIGNGSARMPFNTIADGLDFAEASGIRQLVFLADATLDRNLKNFRVDGLGLSVLDFNGNDVSSTAFERILLTGHSTSVSFWSLLVGGFQDGLSGVQGGHVDINITGEVTLAANAASLFTNLVPAHVPGLPIPALIMPTGAFHKSVLSNLSGDLLLKGFDSVLHDMNIAMNGGVLTIDSSCSDGVIAVTGTGKLINNSTGTAVDTSGLVESLNWDEIL